MWTLCHPAPVEAAYCDRGANRHRAALRAGADLTTSISTAMNTSGRAVLFAGGTVMIALRGMLVLGVGFPSGMAVSASLTVLLTVAAADPMWSPPTGASEIHGRRNAVAVAP